jgi:hypothetical protein
VLLHDNHRFGSEAIGDLVESAARRNLSFTTVPKWTGQARGRVGLDTGQAR